jgi:hypothetical protein
MCRSPGPRERDSPTACWGPIPIPGDRGRFRVTHPRRPSRQNPSGLKKEKNPRAAVRSTRERQLEGRSCTLGDSSVRPARPRVPKGLSGDPGRRATTYRRGCLPRSEASRERRARWVVAPRDRFDDPAVSCPDRASTLSPTPYAVCRGLSGGRAQAGNDNRSERVRGPFAITVDLPREGPHRPVPIVFSSGDCPMKQPRSRSTPLSRWIRSARVARPPRRLECLEGRTDPSGLRSRGATSSPLRVSWAQARSLHPV